QELLREPPEEDLHPRLHELPLRSLAGAVQGHEAVEIVGERLRRRPHHPVAAGLGLQPASLALDLVAQLAGKAREVLLEGRRQLEERSDRVLLDLDAESRIA